MTGNLAAPAALALLVCSCGPPCKRGRCMEEPVPVPHEPMHSVTLTTQAVACAPYLEYETMETPDGEIVTGIDVCAEFENACSCETSERVLHGTARVRVLEEPGQGCIMWELVQAEFWAYPRGILCPEAGGWSLIMDSYPGSICGIALEPQPGEGTPTRMELVCEWTTDDGSARVVDRLYFQILP